MNPDGETLTVHVPIAFRRRRGRKALVAYDGAPAVPATTQRPPEHSAIVRALARAFRWRKLIETGVHSTVQDIANEESINPSYVSRLLRLTLLVPDLVEEVISGDRSELALDRLMQPFPVEWSAQRILSDQDPFLSLSTTSL
jgi:hypothetical protein